MSDGSQKLTKEEQEKRKEEEYFEEMKEEFARRVGYQKRLEEKFEKEMSN